MTRDRKCEEKGREAVGRGTCWGSATATAALAAWGSWLCNAPHVCKPEQPTPASFLMGSECCFHMLLKVFTLLL